MTSQQVICMRDQVLQTTRVCHQVICMRDQILQTTKSRWRLELVDSVEYSHVLESYCVARFHSRSNVVDVA